MSTAPDPKRILVALVLGVPTIIALMLTAFAAPALNSGPEDLPLAVSGPPPAVEQLTANLAKAQPGAFDITTYDSPAAAADAVKERNAIGGISVAPEGVTIHTAAGAGSPYKQLLTGIGTSMAASGQQVTYDELAPTAEGDPAGTGVGTLGLPLVFGGLAGAAGLLLAFRGSNLARVLGALGIALIGGFVATAVLQFGFDALDGSYVLTSLAVSVGIAAIGLAVIGLGAVLGRAGLGLMAVILMFLANPLSGLATGPDWLPAPWGAIGQFLPLGAAGTAIRSVAYFDGAGAGQAWLVLAAWIVVGAGLALMARRSEPTPARE